MGLYRPFVKYPLYLFYIFIDLQAEYRVRDAGYWILDAGCWILDTGCWILDDKLPMTKFGGKNVLQFSRKKN
ncbi:MAG: hypothetical protein JRD05_03820 [Deltaproteobacteria bacterium]|nr:hypothetical protein [Deltaproteobacteria bacterium]